MSEKILVVDDIRENRTLMRDVLLYFGYEVIEAQNGVEAVKLTKERMPSLVFMDVQMPVMDGITAMKMLKTDPETKQIKIISLSGFAADTEMDQFLSAGFDDCISKPVDIRKLPALIQKHLGGAEGQTPPLAKE
jgi:two-component system cell cycle response regulator DivK